MRKILYFLCVLLVSTNLSAQIPNPGFESWTAMTGYDLPDFWGNLNPTTSATGIYTVLKGTSLPAAGLSYIKLTTKDAGGIKPGIIVSGQLDPVTFKPLSGFPYSSRPEKLKGRWQYMGYGNDAATIKAWLTKWNTTTQSRDTIATLITHPSGMLHTWGIFNIPFVYKNSSSPDTAVISISSSGDIPVKNSFIWIDELTFEGIVTGIQYDKTWSGLSVFPNPASSYLKLRFSNPKTEQVTVRFLDNIGNLVLESAEDVNAGDNELSLNIELEKIQSGMYFLQLKSSSGLVTRKVIVRK